MKILQVTLGTGATQIVAGGNSQGTAAPFTAMIIQYNGTNTGTRVGDATVKAGAYGTGKGIIILGSSTTNNQIVQPNFSTVSFGNSQDATQWYIAGTQNDVVDVMLI